MMNLKWRNFLNTTVRLKRCIEAVAGFLNEPRKLRLRKILGITLCNVIFCAPTAFAADVRVQQWQAVEIALTSSQTYTDPFQDVDVTATFTGPDKKAIIRPAFWDGGTTWKVRFAPTQTGLWTMTTSSTDAKNGGLHHVTRTVQCDPYSGNLEIYKHGFLKVSGNGRYLIYDDGIPFFYLGDTHWILAHERFDTSNALGVNSQFKYIADQGLVHANAEIGWVGDPALFPIFTEAYMMRLARYWVARYGAYPVIWTIAQEIDKNYYGAYDATTINKWFAAAQSIADNDAYHHPIMPHMESTDHTTAANSSWSGKPYHSGWAVQWQGDLTDISIAKGFWKASPAKPSVLYESAYDHFWTDSRGALGAAYKAFQYGMYGYGYGANGIWNDLYSKTGEPGDYGTAYEMPAHYFWWRDGADLRTGDQLAYFKHFYSSLEWWKLVPRFNDDEWGALADPSKSLLSSDGADTYVVFFFNSGTSTGTLNQLRDHSTYVAQWFNPRDGQYENIGTFLQRGSQWVIPGRPTAEDWVVLVRRTGDDKSVTQNPRTKQL